MKMKIKEWEYLLVSVLLLTMILSFSTIHTLYSRQAELTNRINELESVCDHNDLLLEQIKESEKTIKSMEERLMDLEKMLFNFKRTTRIISGNDNDNELSGYEKENNIASRGISEKVKWTPTTMPLDMPSGVSAEKYESAFKGTPLEGIGEMLVFVGAEMEINDLVLAGVIAHETDWGNSRLAREKNNLAGLNACGDVYNNAFSFDSRIDSIMFLGNLLVTKYCPGGKFFGGSYDLKGVGVKYAEDPLWAEKVAGCMKKILDKCEN